jgi:hypothetical protein
VGDDAEVPRPGAVARRALNDVTLTPILLPAGLPAADNFVASF